MLEAAHGKARSGAWGDHEGKGAECWGKRGQDFSLAAITGQGVPPRFQFPEFSCHYVPGPHIKMKIKKEKSKNHPRKSNR